MKQLKTCILTFCMAVSAVAVHAQDKIYKNDDGAVIEAKVTKVNDRAITYKRFNNQDGPDYTIAKKDVNRIVYQNGTTDVFGNETAKTGDQKGKKHDKYASVYSPNIFSITPAAYTVSLDGTINDVGIGICYERLLDSRGRVGLNLPVMLAFSSSKDYNNYIYNYNGNTNSYGSYTSFYFMPGIKFYPAPDREKVRYSIGASFFCILGNEPYGVYDNTGAGLQAPSDAHAYSIYGLMVTNSVNITATKHLYFAIDLSAGIPFSDNRHADNDGGLDVIIGPFMQVGFKLGVRY